MSRHILKAGIYFGSLIFLFSFIVLLWVSSIRSAISIKPKFKQTLNAFFPEGWSFFTKSPRDESGDLFKLTDIGHTRIDIQNGSPKFWFGCSRKGRKLGFEISTILSKIDQKKAVISTADTMPFERVSFDTVLLSGSKNITNIDPGKYVIKIYNPVPWVYASRGGIYHNQYKLFGVVLQ